MSDIVKAVHIHPAKDISPHFVGPEDGESMLHNLAGCWCSPILQKPCPEDCKGWREVDAKCWKCGGDGFVSPDDGDPFDGWVIRHNEIDDGGGEWMTTSYELVVKEVA